MPGESRAEYRLGSALPNRLEQQAQIAGVVFQVGVLDDRHVAGHLADGGADRGPFAAVPFVAERTNPGVLGRQALENFPRPVL